MSIIDDLKRLQKVSVDWSWQTKAIAISLFLSQSMAIASIGESAFKFKGFILRGIDFYRDITGWIIDFLEKISLSINQLTLDSMIFFSILILPILKQFFRFQWYVIKNHKLFASLIYAYQNEAELHFVQHYATCWYVAGKLMKVLSILLVGFGIVIGVILLLMHYPETPLSRRMMVAITGGLFYATTTGLLILGRIHFSVVSRHAGADSYYVNLSKVIIITGWSQILLVAIIAAISDGLTR